MTVAGKLIKTLSEIASNSLPDNYECVVVGCGPAGLTAGIYLGRYLRKTLVIDGPIAPRASWIPTSRNFPGYVNGVHGIDLLKNMRDQCLEFGAKIESGQATNLRKNNGLFELTLNGRIVTAQTILLATGIRNLTPNCISEEQRVKGTASRLIRYCPICDLSYGKIGVIGSFDHGMREAMFMYTYSKDITVIPVNSDQLSTTDKNILSKFDLKYTEAHLTSINLGVNSIICNLSNNSSLTFDCIYPSLGSTIYNQLAKDINVQLDSTGCIIVNDHCMTNIKGVYAAGDITSGLDQLVTAMDQAAKASTDMHNLLRQRELDLPTSQVEIPIKSGHDTL